MKLRVTGVPPVYDSGYSVSNPGHPRHAHWKTLADKARETMAGKKLLEGPLKLESADSIGPARRPRPDATNIIRGIANAHQDVVYKDDGQLHEVHYAAESTDLDRYEVQVWERSR